MAGLVGLAIVAAMAAVHTVVAAVSVRLLRVRLETPWGPPAAALVLVPMVLFASTLVVAGGLGLGADLGGADVAWFVLVVVPLGLGLAIDYLWMPAPEDVELPEAAE